MSADVAAEISAAVLAYGLHIDLLEFDELEQLFVADARASYGGRDWVEGAAAIVAFVTGHSAGRAFAQHLISVARVTVHDDGTALAIANMQAVQASVDEPASVHHGRYHVRLVLDSARWRITELRLEVLSRSTLGH